MKQGDMICFIYDNEVVVGTIDILGTVGGTNGAYIIAQSRKTGRNLSGFFSSKALFPLSQKEKLKERYGVH